MFPKCSLDVPNNETLSEHWANIPGILRASLEELSEEFKKHFTSLGKNTEKYISFIVPIEKQVTRIDKNEGEITKNTTYILQFIESAIFMASSLPNLASDLSEGVYKIKCKFGYNDKKCETCGIKNKYCHCFLK